MTELEPFIAGNVNRSVQPLVHELVSQAADYQVAVLELDDGVKLVDAGIDVAGGLAAGCLIAEICMGGLGSVSLSGSGPFTRWRKQIDVVARNPVIACLGSQYAGWSLNCGEGKSAFYALGSGPARAMGSREDLFDELNYRTPPGDTVIVLEVDKNPPREIIDKVITRCEINSEQLTVILTPTTSLAGGVQIAARVLEVALHKIHELGFPLVALVDGAGTTPLPPPSKHFLTAMGRTNDAILFGGDVQLYVDTGDVEAERLARQLPSSSSRDFGKPFAQVFKDYEYDFYKIDPLLFSPAKATVTNVATGHSFESGTLHEGLLDQSFSNCIE